MSIVTKSYENSGNVIVDYCSKLSVRQHELQKELQELTIKSAPMAGMLGAPEVLTLGANFIQLIGAKNILDIGTFTGASALAWSLAAGDNDQFLTEGREGTFDFVFIDADKENYPSYYERAVRLIKSGGVIMVDNALWNGRVAKDISTFDKSTKFINETNYIIFNDNRTNSSLINCGDGIHIAFKK